ncbi:MAG: hypothetical protein RLZZ262_970 [Bacteroidota bacterium]
MVDAMSVELLMRKIELAGQPIASIYFGGGTPSILSELQLGRLLDQVFRDFEVVQNAEITLEANPDDLTPTKIAALAKVGINRLSIGVQSFDDEQLRRMNRAHTSQQADAAIKCAQDKGIENITADLIFALPGLTVENYRNDVQRLLQTGVQHLSAYGLTIEPRTVFHRWATEGRIKESDAVLFEQHFRATPEIARTFGLEHYEVSNFGRPDFYSKHNTAYWKGHHYLGIGPSAHSYDGASRRWNISNNPQYLKKIAAGEAFWETEYLTDAAKCNEYLMTGLRTRWGVERKVLAGYADVGFGDEQFARLDEYVERGLAKLEEDRFVLTLDGLLQVDTLTADVFVAS